MYSKINSRIQVLVFVFFILSIWHTKAQQALGKGIAFEQNAKLGRGVNIIGYDPLWKDFSKARMKDKHFKMIKEAGFNNVRLVISSFKFSLKDSIFTINPDFFKTLDWSINESLKNKLVVIVDFHEHNAMRKDPINDRNIIVAGHYYSPIQFTHQCCPLVN